LFNSTFLNTAVDLQCHPLYTDFQKSLDLLEWSVLLDLISLECPSIYGQYSWQERPFLNTIEEMQLAQVEVAFLAQLLNRYGEPTHTPQGDVRLSLESLKQLQKGGILTLNEWVDLFHGLHHGRHYINHVQKYKSELKPNTAVFAFLESVASPVAWWTYLSEKINPDGSIRESASSELSQLKRRAKSQEQEIMTTLQRMLTTPTIQKALQDAMIVQRNGRYVLPVNVFYKTSVPGIVHDVSSSGSTVFIEPKRVVELSNRLQETQTAIQKEIERILKQMSEDLQPEAESMLCFFEALMQLERHWAAARLAKRLEAHAVKLTLEDEGQEAHLNLKQLKHPLLCLQMGVHQVVGNDVSLGTTQGITKNSSQRNARCMVITGPNTGGKTVLLKSVGLAVLMVQAGLLPLVAEESSLSYFSMVLADIGDSQSLQHNLSTFSGQMSRLARFAELSISLEKTLILLDEIAVGTDPIEGSALAQALLKRFYDKGAFVMVTTHLGVLKQEAYRHAGYVNASVAFDIDALAPTYRLLIGVPGASNALAIAQRLGMDDTLIQNAQERMQEQQSDSATLLTTLEQEKHHTQASLESVQHLKEELETRLNTLKQEQQQFREKKKQWLTDYQAQFKARLNEFEVQAKRLKKELKQAESSSQSLAFAQQRIARFKEKVGHHFEEALAPIEADLQEHAASPPTYTFHVGEDVRHPKLAGKSKVVSISSDGKKLTLQNGGIHLVVKTAEVEPLGLSAESVKAMKKAAYRQLKQRIQQQHQQQEQVMNVASIRGTFKLECDVRGKRVHEALIELEAFLDNAHMTGLNTVSVIHGQGTGALKQAVRDYLKTCVFVADYYPEQAHLGGDGKTIIEMKETPL
jgi:DNA mismatch repair protein MutS2